MSGKIPCDPASSEVEPLEEVIDDLGDEMKKRHIDRLREGRCTIEHDASGQCVHTGRNKRIRTEGMER